MLMTYESTAGLTTVGYRIINDDKTQDTALTTTGVTEVSAGCYGVNLADAKAGKTIQWYEGATYSVSERIPVTPLTAAGYTTPPSLDAITAAVVPGIAAASSASPAGDQLHIVRGTDYAPEFDFGRTLTAAACAWTLTLVGATTAAVTKSATVTGDSWQPSIPDTETDDLGDLYEYKVTVTEGSSTTVTHAGLVVVTG